MKTPGSTTRRITRRRDVSRRVALTRAQNTVHLFISVDDPCSWFSR
jgi:hypothetical protein